METMNTNCRSFTLGGVVDNSRKYYCIWAIRNENLCQTGIKMILPRRDFAKSHKEFPILES